MRLELDIIPIKGIEFGPGTRVQGDVLQVNQEELTALLEQDPRLEKVELQLASPGESCRILQVADVIEPRAKLDGSPAFPGAVGDMQSAGQGGTRVLQGAAVVLNDLSESHKLVEHDNAIGILIDMSGPAADYSPYAHTYNLVISPQPVDGLSHDAYKVALRMAGLKASEYLAKCTIEQPGQSTEVYELPPLTQMDPAWQDLPKVVYNFQVYCTSYPAVTGEPILYGDNIRTMLPVVVHPNEVLDGGVINPYHGIGTETYVIQNHPIIKELYAQHGKSLCFAGVILTVSRYTEPDRERVVAMVANTAKSVMGADGIIITKSSSGAPDVDAAQTAHACEENGVKAVMVMFDRSDGAEVGAVFNLSGARSIVSTANQYEELALPAVERTIGRYVELPNGTKADGEFNKPIRWIRGGLDQVGHQSIRPFLY